MRSISRREAMPARASSLAMRCGPSSRGCGAAGTMRLRLAPVRHRMTLRSLRWRMSFVGVSMLFGKRKQVVKRILIVEDEPLTAFDNENMLGDCRLRDRRDGRRLRRGARVARARRGPSGPQPTSGCTAADRASSSPQRAKERGVPTLFATGHRHAGAAEHRRVGCLMKPYTERQLCKAIEMRRPAPPGREGQAAQGARTVSSTEAE